LNDEEESDFVEEDINVTVREEGDSVDIGDA